LEYRSERHARYQPDDLLVMSRLHRCSRQESASRPAFLQDAALCWLTLCLAILCVILLAKPTFSEELAPPPSPDVRISQVYGGGGNSGATLKSDFIEMFNASPNPIDLSAWSVQYTSANGSTWSVTPLSGQTIPGYGYLLVRQAQGGGGSDTGTAIEFPDVSGGTNLSAADGKIAVVRNSEPILGIDDPDVVDFVGYGGANQSEGAPVGTLSNTTAAIRNNGGCNDSNSNQGDFTRAAPIPRNRSSATYPCAPPNTPTPTNSETPLPVNTDTPTVIPTDTATPTPVDTATFTPTATETPALPPTDTPSETPILLPTDTPVETPPLPPSATLTVTPVPTTLPAILISEFMADPKIAADAQGEWFELYNAGSESVNLRGWRVVDLGSDAHIITTDLVVPPDAYVVLARNGDPAANGGVPASYVYTGLTLANTTDTLILLAPNGSEVDRVQWSSAFLPVAAGKSWERLLPASPQTWLLAAAPWPGSAGDWGSPGAALMLPTPTATETTIPLPSATPTVAPTLGLPPAILFSEFLANPQAVGDAQGEWFELYNAGSESVNLRGWRIVDLGSDAHAIVADLVVPPGTYVVLARNGDPAANGGVIPQYIYSGINLANTTDALILLAPGGSEVDRVQWSSAFLPVAAGKSWERLLPASPQTWLLAAAPWPGSAGNWGSPGVALMLPTPTPTATETPIPPPIATPTITPTFGAQPAILFSEFLADPQAVGDAQGEWFELYNASSESVNLRGWRIVDLGSDAHAIVADLVVPPGAYVVLARNSDPAVNGGVPVNYVYAGLTLANTADALILLAPSGSEVDRLVWGEQQRIIPGKSLERTAFDHSGQWLTAAAPWPGSVGDWGTPGWAYHTLVAPTFMPVSAATASPTPISSGSWLIIETPGALQIDEVNFDGSDLEYVALFNNGSQPLDLGGWLVGDAEAPGDNEGLYVLPNHVLLPAGDLFVIARNGAAFASAWGENPDAEFEDSSPAILSLDRQRNLASGSWALSDGGDEVVLLDPQLRLADAAAFGTGAYAALGLTSELRATASLTLQRVPGATFPLVRDLRHRFLAAPPRPLEIVELPLEQGAPPVPLVGDLQAVWGTLGARSNFSPGETAPPHYLLAAAAASRLNFVALADPIIVQPLALPATLTWLPAWRWQPTKEQSLIIYNSPLVETEDVAVLLNTLAATGGVVQAQGTQPPAGLPLTAFAADNVEAPARLTSLLKIWQSAVAPLLPAGNSNPPLPAAINPQARYTGLAVHTADPNGIVQAIQARRGWLTSAPGIWLTLRAELADGSQRWMGETAPSSTALTLQVQYGDQAGQLAGLALWLNNRPLQVLDIPPGDGLWRLQIVAEPGAFLYAVAVQADGDFAVTAPILIPPDQPAPLPPAPPEDLDPALPGGAAPNSESTEGQAGGAPASVAYAKRFGLDVWVEFRARVIAPPGLFNNSFYVADPAVDGATANIGIQVFLRNGELPALQEGDWVLIRGFLRSFRGEMELEAETPEQIWRIDSAPLLQPLPVMLSEIGEPLEARLVTFTGEIVGWQGESILLADPQQPDVEPVRVTIRGSLGWRRPYVKLGERWTVTGIVSQFAREQPWNGGYRVLVRYKSDLVRR
jgi:hypothetical protein